MGHYSQSVRLFRSSISWSADSPPTELDKAKYEEDLAEREAFSHFWRVQPLGALDERYPKRPRGIAPWAVSTQEGGKKDFAFQELERYYSSRNVSAPDVIARDVLLLFGD